MIKKYGRGNKPLREEIARYVLNLYLHDAGFKALLSCFIRNTPSKLQKKKKNSKKYVNKVSQTMSSRKGGAIFPLKKQYVCLVKCKYKIIIIINNNNLFLIRRK